MAAVTSRRVSGETAKLTPVLVVASLVTTRADGTVLVTLTIAASLATARADCTVLVTLTGSFRLTASAEEARGIPRPPIAFFAAELIFPRLFTPALVALTTAT